jgi:hypothetical protein
MNNRSHACAKQVLVAGFLFGQQNVLRAKQEWCYCLKKVDLESVINVTEHILQTTKNTLNWVHLKRNIGWLIKLATNVSHIPEGGDCEAQNYQLTMSINRSTDVHFSTKTPLLGICCYKPFLFGFGLTLI